MRADWEQMLAHQLPQLPPFDSVWEELPAVFAWLEREEVKAPRPAMGALRAEIDEGWRMPAMAHSWRAEGVGAPLEIIRFAATNHLCVDLNYQDEQGITSSRIIEPYSLRRTQAGDLLLYAVRSQDGQDRSYRVDRIRDARATKQPFTPRYAVELSAAVPLHAPDTTRSREPATSYAFSPAPKPRSVSRRTTRSSGGYGQPKYVFQCSYCQKKFERQQYDGTLNPHKTKDGYPCPSRTGYYVTTKY